MSPAVAELISQATADAFVTWIVADAIRPYHRAGTLHFETEDLIEIYGRDLFENAHWLCDLQAEAEALRG